MADGIVTVLREYECNCSPPGGEVMCVPCRAAAEIERLRVAGDALHAAVRNHDLTEAHLRAWEEARHG